MSWDSPSIPDFYRDGLPDLPNPRVALGWATAHAANAYGMATDSRNHAREANQKLDRVIERLERIETQMNAGKDSADLRADLQEAISEIGPFYLRNDGDSSRTSQAA